MHSFLLPSLFAMFVWWLTTVLIMYLDGLPQRTFKWSLLGATVLLGASLYGLYLGRNDTTLSGAYWAFAWGVVAWGWQEISFYMGYVTGPRREGCAPDCRGWRHFGHAIQTSLYHELAIIATSVVVVAATWDGANQVGRWTFLIMWWMHQSAKLNVFLGVRNLNEEFLPEHLQFLRSFLKKKPMNPLFPVSVTVSTVIATVLVRQAMQATDTFAAAGNTFLAVLMILAILEHWLLVLPIPAAALWQMGLKSRGVARPADIEVVAGFLGAGKTTLMRRMLATADPSKRTIVLVNDFGEAGVDSSLLKGRGADVVELPNGCICCSLRSDLASQLREVVLKWTPDRVLIEPSGVAEVAELVRVLNRPDVKDLVRSLTVHTVVDASSFLRDYARLPRYFEAQASFAPVVVINKTDLVTPAQLTTVQGTIRSLNPSARLLSAVYGIMQEGVPGTEPLTAAKLAAVMVEGHPHHHEEGDHDHDAGHAERPAALGLGTWSAQLPGVYDEGELQRLLHRGSLGAYGELFRVKGVACVSGGWVQFHLAGGNAEVAAFAPQPGELPRVMVIGRRVAEDALALAFAGCRNDEPAATAA
jgi:putative photosynthetic complex assembly protein 2